MRDQESLTKAHRLLLFSVLVALVAIIAIEVMTKSLGIPGVPPRGMLLMIVSLICAAGASIWQIKRHGRRDVRATPPTREAERRSFPGNLAKIIGLAAILEAFLFGIVSVVFRRPVSALLLPYLLFLMPVLAGFPLILHARQFFDRPKACSVRSALGMAVFCSLVTVAGFYSGLYGWLELGSWTVSDVIGVTLFTSAVVFAATYYWMNARLASAKSR